MTPNEAADHVPAWLAQPVLPGPLQQVVHEIQDLLLDTNIVSDLIRHPQGRVARHIREVGEARVCTSIIVAAELRYGATKE